MCKCKYEYDFQEKDEKYFTEISRNKFNNGIISFKYITFTYVNKFIWPLKWIWAFTGFQILYIGDFFIFFLLLLIFF